jgi:hypothetical protein
MGVCPSPYWQAWGISWVLSQYDPVANGVDTSQPERVSPIEWDNVVLHGQYILTGNSSAGAGPKNGRSYPVPQRAACRPSLLVGWQRGAQFVRHLANVRSDTEFCS